MPEGDPRAGEGVEQRKIPTGARQYGDQHTDRQREHPAPFWARGLPHCDTAAYDTDGSAIATDCTVLPNYMRSGDMRVYRFSGISASFLSILGKIFSNRGAVGRV